MPGFLKNSTLAFVGAVTLLSSACQRRPAAPELGPRAVVDQLIALRNSRSYDRMAPYVVTHRAAQLTSLLVAVDAFLAADQELRDYLRDHVGFGVGPAVDLSYIANSLGIFSRDVAILDEVVAASTAQVVFTIAEQLPVQRAELRREAGGWRYDPGPGFHPDFPRAFHALAEGLRAVTRDLRAGKIRTSGSQTDPEVLRREMQLRLAPGLRMLPSAPALDPAP